tara:strand:- start:13312 stop:14346 length:1035 start_codon:yes stop_codon:yes gene_type:complete
MCQAFSMLIEEVDLVVDDRVVGGKKELDEYYHIDSSFSLYRIPGVFSVSNKFLYSIGTLRFVLNFILKVGVGKYDVIFSRNELILFILSLFKKPEEIIWESHSKSVNVFSRYLMKKGIRVVVTSTGLQKLYLEYLKRKDQIILAPNGIDESFFEVTESKHAVRKKLGLEVDAKIVMYIGGLDKWKGVDSFLEASNHQKNVTFVVIGGSVNEVEVLKKKYPLVVFLGERPYYDLKHNQCAADVLVVPNTAKNELSAEYTSPLKLFAHMTSSVPVVASKIPSIVTIKGSEHFTFFEPDDPRDLAQTINTVIQNYDVKLRSAKELVKIARNFTWIERARKILAKQYA